MFIVLQIILTHISYDISGKHYTWRMLRIEDHHDHLKCAPQIRPADLRSRDARSVPDVVIHNFFFLQFSPIFCHHLYQVSGTRQTLIHKKI